MARTRQISPDFFLNEDLADCDPEARILFAGLWCIADREGKLKDRPRKVAAMVLPYTACNVIELLDQLAAKSFIKRYEVDGEKYIIIPNFCKRQKIHPHESKSFLPNPLEQSSTYVAAGSTNVLINNPLPSLPSCTKPSCKGGGKNTRAFVKPTLDEVIAYCAERKNKIDPQYFIDYQDAREWKFKGGQKMKDWKATIRYWERNGFTTKPKENDEPFDLQAETKKALGL